MRHYEILAAGGVPYFPDISLFPRWVLSHLPKELLKRVHHLPGVQHIGSAEDLLSPSDLQFYNQSTSPKWVKGDWQQQQVMLMDRLERIHNGHAPSALLSQQKNKMPDNVTLLWDRCIASLERRGPTEAMINLFWGVGSVARDRALLKQILSTEITGDGCASALHTSRDDIRIPIVNRSSHIHPAWEGTATEWAVWMIAMVLEEFFDEGCAPIRSMSSHAVTLSPIKTTFFFRLRDSRIFNFLRSGSIDLSLFSPDAYYQLANDLHEFSRKYLSTASVAANFLRVLGREEARSIIFFGSVNPDYLTFSLWHGLLELGINITAVPLAIPKERDLHRGPSFLPSDKRRRSLLVRDLGENGGDKLRIWGGSEYAAWRHREALDTIYGKNFLVGKRIPHHRMITEKEACEMIANITSERDKVDVIVLGFSHFMVPFGAYPCARELRELIREQQHSGPSARRKHPAAQDNQRTLRGDVAVAYVDGSDKLIMQTATSFFKEGITVFAREPACW
jgi:hypothetical protein